MTTRSIDGAQHLAHGLGVGSEEVAQGKGGRADRPRLCTHLPGHGGLACKCGNRKHGSLWPVHLALSTEHTTDGGGRYKYEGISIEFDDRVVGEAHDENDDEDRWQCVFAVAGLVAEYFVS